MCNPAIMLGAQAAGAGMSAVGSFFGAKSEKSSLRHRAALADINAGVADAEARNALYAGNVEESRVKLAGAQAKSQQRTQMTSSGIDIAGSNTALARLTGTDVITEVDANMVRANALRAAWGQRMEATNQRSQANSARASAKSISPALAGATSLINSAGSVASSWYSLNREGGFSQGKGRGGTVTMEQGADQGREPYRGPYDTAGYADPILYPNGYNMPWPEDLYRRNRR